MSTYKRFENETDEELIFRITGDKDKIGSWQDVADILNELLGTNYNASTFRKKRQYFDIMMNANEHIILQDKNYIEELKRERQELYKERQKLSDERTELNRLLRREARKESYLEMVQRVISEDTIPIKFDIEYKHIDSDNSLLVHLTDIHAGIYIDNFKNIFDEHVLKQRIEKYTNEIIDIQKRHRSKDAYVVVGEILSGLIHNNLRLQNNMDLIEQFKLSSELIASMLISLGENFENVYMYTTMGNHSRISPKKEDALDGENMDILLPYYLKARLQNIDNIHIEDNDFMPDVAVFRVHGKLIMASHGHKDSPSNVVQNFTLLYRKCPDIILLGHRHTNGLTTVFDTKVIESGCVSGADQYALDIRKATHPEQTVSVINNNGLVCIYDIQLDN